MKIKARHTFFLLCGLFLTYSISIYLQPLSATEKTNYDKVKATNGRLVWQTHNCQSCHQFYGLGGYLGPDLTNVMSQNGKGETLIRAMVKTGTKQMPAFNIPENELSDLIEFLRSVDASGKADPRNFKTNDFGLIEAHEIK
jgi:nitric oxide reductase subunit C